MRREGVENENLGVHLTCSKSEDKIVGVRSGAVCSWRYVDDGRTSWVPLAGGALHIPEYLLLKAVILLLCGHASEQHSERSFSVVIAEPSPIPRDARFFFPLGAIWGR